MSKLEKIVTKGHVGKFLITSLLGAFIGAVQAAPPIPFSQYTVNNGAVDATAACSQSGVISCSDQVVDNGFLQQKVTTTSGTYLQFILTDPNATGDAQAAPFTTSSSSGLNYLGFTNEDFVKMNSATEGIASRNTIASSTVTGNKEDRVVDTTQYLFGWAQPAFLTPWVQVHQEITQLDITDPVNPTVLMNSTAYLTSVHGNSTDPSIGRDITVSQMVKTGTSTTGGSDVQKFQYRSLDFDNFTCHNDPNCGTTPNPSDTLPSPLLPGGTNGGDISWVAGQHVSATWIGQSTDTGGGTQSPFGYTNYSAYDLNSGLVSSTTSLTSLSNPDAAGAGWNNNPFGTVDTLASTSAVLPAASLVYGTPTGGTVTAGTGSSDTTAGALPAGFSFDNWSVNNGVFTVAAAGAPVVNEDGAYQRVLSDGSGQEYIQTIITDQNATGNSSTLGFSTENLVKINNGSSNQTGIASRLNIASADVPGGGGKFQYSTALKTGWANGGPLDPTVEINQSLSSPDTNTSPQASAVLNTFYLAQGQTSADKIMDIGSYAGTVTTLPTTNINRPVMFRTKVVQGAFQNTTGGVTLPNTSSSSGGSIAWSAGDAIQATWMGANYNVADPYISPDIISANSYTNLSTGARTSYNDVKNIFNITADPNPFTWVSPFADTPANTSLYNTSDTPVTYVPTYSGLITPP